MTTTRKFVIGAVGGLAPQIVMLAIGKIDTDQLTLVEAGVQVGTSLLLAGLTCFISTLYDETVPLKLFWVGVSLPSLILNISAQGAPPKQPERTVESRPSAETASQVFALPFEAVVHAQKKGEMQGVVSGIAGACPTVTWMIGTTRFRADTKTNWDDNLDRCSDLRNGMSVEIEYQEEPSGTRYATEVDSLVPLGQQIRNGILRALGRRVSS